MIYELLMFFDVIISGGEGNGNALIITWFPIT
jgi:hypothetical protein